MRALALLFAAFVTTAGVAAAQEGTTATDATAPPTSPAQAAPSSPKDAPPAELPVSLERIRKELGKPPRFSVDGVRDTPTFKIEIQERNRLQEILATLDVKAGPTPAGGIYAAEMQRVMFPSVDNPLRQPYSEFGQKELLTIILENLLGRYLVGKAYTAITDAQREAAEAAARDEVRRVIAEYCAGQPNRGAGIKICTDPPE